MSSPLKTPNMEPQNQNLPHLKPSGSLTSLTQPTLNNTNALINTAPSTLSAAAPRGSKRRFEEVSEEVNNGFLQPDEQEYFKSFPPGYRFNPYDEELVLYYLRKKVKNEKLPPNQMVEVDLYKHNPEFLAEKYKDFGEDQWYFFTPRDRKYRNGTRPKRSAGDGYWKATGADKPIYHNQILIGYRKALVFYKGKPPKGDKTNWIMHEFRVSEPSSRTKRSPDDMRLDDWVLCRIYKKPEKQKDNEDFESREEEDNNHDDDHDDDHDGNEHMEVESRSTSAINVIDPSSRFYGSDHHYVNQTFSAAFNDGRKGPESDHCYLNQTFSAPTFDGSKGPESESDHYLNAAAFNDVQLPPELVEPILCLPSQDMYLNELEQSIQDGIYWEWDSSIPNLVDNRIPPPLDFSYIGQLMPPWPNDLPGDNLPSDPPNKP